MVALGFPARAAANDKVTSTRGVVSATDAQFRDPRFLDVPAYKDAIQTDTALNPGYSGGPLADLDGRLVGANAAARTTGSDGRPLEGQNYAVSIDRTRAGAGGAASRPLAGLDRGDVRLPDDRRAGRAAPPAGAVRDRRGARHTRGVCRSGGPRRRSWPASTAAAWRRRSSPIATRWRGGRSGEPRDDDTGPAGREDARGPGGPGVRPGGDPSADPKVVSRPTPKAALRPTPTAALGRRRRAAPRGPPRWRPFPPHGAAEGACFLGRPPSHLLAPRRRAIGGAGGGGGSQARLGAAGARRPRLAGAGDRPRIPSPG